MDPITNDAIETGPTPRCRELPNAVYIRGGTKLESAQIYLFKFIAMQTRLEIHAQIERLR